MSQPGIDHATQALEWLSRPPDPGTIGTAQVYATLALYEAVLELVVEVNAIADPTVRRFRGNMAEMARLSAAARQGATASLPRSVQAPSDSVTGGEG